jgi:hypothetical protein
MTESEFSNLNYSRNFTNNTTGILSTEMIHSGSTIRAFERMFWAFLFFFDFRIGFNNVHIDILPDFVGWILFATAFGWILELHSDIKFMRTLSYLLIFLSLFELVEIRVPLKKAGYLTFSFSPLFIIGIIAGILTIIVVWKLCGVIIDMAATVNNTLIKDRAEFRRNLYIGFIIATFIVVPICMVIPPLIIITVIIALPLAIVILCLMMGLMKGTANMCREETNLSENLPDNYPGS